MKEYEKTEVIVGIEPTGHYWLNLAYFLEERGIPLSCVIRCTSSVQRRLDDNLQRKMTEKMR